MSKLIILVGPPGSGKSTHARALVKLGMSRFNQDEQGKGHLHDFDMAVFDKKDIVVDRMNFNKQQRSRYLDIAKKHGYNTMIIVLHENHATCFERIMKRENHETIKDEKSARSALQTFFTKYERPTKDEADTIEFRYPEGERQRVIYSDLDGTLCDVEHRRHHVRKPEGQKKDWAAFFREIPNDTVNQPVLDILNRFSSNTVPERYRIPTVFCSGRSTNEKRATVDWLNKHVNFPYSLYMRDRGDSRQDSIVKEILLDFELLTRYDIYFCLDDRDQVVKMLRGRGLTVLQVAEGDF